MECTEGILQSPDHGLQLQAGDKNNLKLEDRSQKKKLMFLHSKNKASRKGYKGEC